MRELLNAQADRIEQVLLHHGVTTSVYGGVATPALTQFHLALAPGVRLNRVAALSDELALALGAAECRLQRKGSALYLEFPRQISSAGGQSLLSLARRLGHLPPHTALLGADAQGSPLLLRLSSPDVAHVLVAGTTGSGKTELARTMVTSLAWANAPDALRFLLVDPKGRAFREFAGLPHLVCPVVTETAEALERLRGLVAEMERRDRAAQQEPRVTVVVDELADLILASGRAAQEVVTRLVQRGREAGIHVVACTQRPTAVVIGGMVKANFPCRLVGRVVSPEDAKIATGMRGTGAERLRGRGDFLAVACGEVQRFQVVRAGRDDILSLAEAGTALTRGGRKPAEGARATRENGALPYPVARLLRLVK